MKTLYELLGVERTATTAQIRVAFRKLSKVWHPDVSKKTNAHGMFQDLVRAYEILTDPEKRKIYDETGDVGVAGGGRPSIDSMLAEAWSQLIDHDAFVIGNPVERLQRHVRDTRKKLDERKNELSKRMAHWKKMAIKIKCSGETNLLRDVVHHRVENASKELLQLESALKTQTLMEARVMEFSLEPATETEELRSFYASCFSENIFGRGTQ